MEENIAGTIYKSVAFEHIKDWALNYLSSSAIGIVSSVGLVLEYGIGYVIFCLIALIYIIAAIKNKNDFKIISAIFIILFLLCANVFSVTLVIMPLQRYLLYLFPPIYVGVIIILKAFLTNKSNILKENLNE